MGAKNSKVKVPTGMHELIYFDGAGTAESSRIALHAAGATWTDTRIKGEEYKAAKEKGEYKTGLPVLKLPSGEVYTQSRAILRYVGKGSGLYPADPKAALAVDEALEIHCDIFAGLPPSTDPEGRKAFCDGKLKVFFGLLEERLGDNDFITGKNISVADLHIGLGVNSIQGGAWDHVEKTYTDQFEKLTALAERVNKSSVVTNYKAAKEAEKKAADEAEKKAAEEAEKKEAGEKAAEEKKEEAPKDEETAAAGDGDADKKEEAPKDEAAAAAVVTAVVADAEATPKRVLMVLTSNDKLGDTGEQTGWYLPEVAHPHKVFADAGFKMTYASIKGGEAPLDIGSIEASKDDDSQQFYKDEALMKLTKETIAIADAKPEDYDVIFYAGGFGTMWDFPDSEASAKLAGEIYDQGGIVSAVCHGPSALVNVKLSDGTLLVKGKKVTAFTNAEEDAVSRREVVPFTCEDKLTELGAEFVDGGVFKQSVQVSDRLMTGQNPPSAQPLAEAIVKALA